MATINFNDYTLSRHLVEDREDRLFNVLCSAGGAGEIVKEVRVCEKGMRPRIEAVTSTGLLIIFSGDKKVIITLYMININKLVALYDNKNIPPYLRKIALKNTSKSA